MSDSQSIPTWTTERRLFAAHQMQGLLANPILTNELQSVGAANDKERLIKRLAQLAIAATDALTEALDEAQ